MERQFAVDRCFSSKSRPPTFFTFRQYGLVSSPPFLFVSLHSFHFVSFPSFRKRPQEKLHEIILPILIPVLVARADHVLLGEELVVGVILLPLLLLPLLGDAGFLLLPGLLLGESFPPQLLETVLLLLAEVGVLLDFGLVEAVDDGVLALGDEDASDLLLILEADLADGHAAVLAEVGPGGVDDGDVVLLVPLDRVGLCELAEVREEVLRDGVPCFALAEAEVDVRARELVYVELEGRDCVSGMCVCVCGWVCNMRMRMGMGGLCYIPWRRRLVKLCVCFYIYKYEIRRDNEWVCGRYLPDIFLPAVRDEFLVWRVG
jgi:hypothetical protein